MNTTMDMQNVLHMCLYWSALQNIDHILSRINNSFQVSVTMCNCYENKYSNSVFNKVKVSRSKKSCLISCVASRYIGRLGVKVAIVSVTYFVSNPISLRTKLVL